jgi:membrane-associated phospholipid phosphatase
MMLFLQMGNLRAFRDTLLSWWLAIAIGWIGYVLVPAIGPQYTLRHTYVRPVFDVEPILRRGTEYLDRATFPSLHTGFSVTVLLLVWRYSSNWVVRIAFTIWVSGIVFTTMYLRFHYVVDVIAGVALAMLAAHLGPRLNDWWDRGEQVELPDVAKQQGPSAAPSPAEG